MSKSGDRSEFIYAHGSDVPSITVLHLQNTTSHEKLLTVSRLRQQTIKFSS